MKRLYEKVLKENWHLETERLILRKFITRDREDAFEFGSDEKTLEYLIWEGFADISQADNAIIGYYSNPGVYAVVLKATRKCIGCIDIRLKTEDEKASLGYVLNRYFWNQGYMSEALEAVLRLCFDVLGLNRVEAEHFLGNSASGRVMEKCGMKFEGVSFQGRKVKGKYTDCVHYAVLRSEWDELMHTGERQ